MNRHLAMIYAHTQAARLLDQHSESAAVTGLADPPADRDKIARALRELAGRHRAAAIRLIDGGR